MSSRLSILFLICCCLWSSVALAQDNILQKLSQGAPTAQITARPISANQAFTLTVKRQPTFVKLIWNIQPQHFLYQQKLSFRLKAAPKAQIGKIQYPKALTRQDPFFGEQQVYANQLVLTLPIKGIVGPQSQLVVGYRGCSNHLCYPPQHKLITLAPKVKGTGEVLAAPSKPQLEQQRYNPESLWGLVLLFGLGILMAFTPCVLPMVPILSGIIVGQKDKVSTWRAVRLSACYVLGMALTYAVFGMVIARLGAGVQLWFQQPWVLSVVAIILVLLALSLFGAYRLQLPHFIQKRVMFLYQHQHRGHCPGVFIMGILSTLVLSPCTSAPLIGVMGFILQTGDVWRGALALFVLALGMGVPLMLVGAGCGRFVPKAGAWMTQVQYFLGVLLLAMAIWVVGRFLPSYWVMLSLAILIVVYAAFWGTYQRVAKGWPLLFKALGILATLYGLALFVGALGGATNPLKPLSFLSQSESVTAPKVKGHVVHTVAALKHQLALAKASGKPILIDYYAKWCTDCRKMAAYTFPNKQVQQALKAYYVIKADVSASDHASKQLLSHYRVLGLPTVLVLSSDGQERKRASGGLSPAELLPLLSLPR